MSGQMVEALNTVVYGGGPGGGMGGIAGWRLWWRMSSGGGFGGGQMPAPLPAMGEGMRTMPAPYCLMLQRQPLEFNFWHN